MMSAAEDPARTRCITELSSDHTVSIRMELDQATKLMFNNFIDEMFNQLAKPYTTSNNEVIYIKASRATVTNIARAFAQARLLDVNLARKTQGFYVEPENLLTDHHGTNGPAQKGDLPWGTCRHLPQLPQNELGISYQNSRGIASAHPAGQKTKQASRLNTPATDSSDIPVRSPTLTSCNLMRSNYVPPTSTRLAKDKTHLAFWPFVAPPNASEPNREETTKSNAYALFKALQEAKTVQRR